MLFGVCGRSSCVESFGKERDSKAVFMTHDDSTCAVCHERAGELVHRCLLLLEPGTKAGCMDITIKTARCAPHARITGETDIAPLVVALRQGRSTSHDASEFNSGGDAGWEDEC